MKASNKKSVLDRLRQFLSNKWWKLLHSLGLRQRIDLRQCIGVGLTWVWNYRAKITVAFVGGVLVIAFVSVMFSDGTAGTFQEWLGTDTKKETLEFLGLGISGVIAFYGLIVFNRRAAAQDESNELTRRGLSQERLKAAIDHLANKDSETARIASFYEFFYLAKDNKDDYAQTVLDILCAHLRRINSSIDSTEESAEKANALEVKILIDILFEYQTAYVFNELHFDLQGVDLRKAIFPREVNLQGANFMGANLEGAKLPEADLNDANLEGANLSAADLEGTYLQDANLTNANLEGANLRRAHLQHANLARANLHIANLQEARLWDANLYRANLMRAELCDASLEIADLRYANFLGADLKGTSFDGADLRGTDLSCADNLEYAIMVDEIVDEETQYPSGCKKPEE